MTYRIVLDRELCSGFGECADLAPGSFRIEADGRAVALVAVTEDARVRDAAAACPMAAIRLVEQDAA
jgi:ferredoxin